MRCPSCNSWLVRRLTTRSFTDALFRTFGRFPYQCGMCRVAFRSATREMPVQVIACGEAARDTIQIACSWGLR